MNTAGSQRAHDSLCAAISRLLTLRGIAHARVGQKASQRRDGSWYSGSDRGAWDIFACIDGRAVAIEAKTGKAWLSGQQIEFGYQWQEGGGLCLVVTDIARLDAALRPSRDDSYRFDPVILAQAGGLIRAEAPVRSAAPMPRVGR